MRGELLKLGLRVCKRTIQKYMKAVRTPQTRGQTWATDLEQPRRTGLQPVEKVLSKLISKERRMAS